MSEMFDGLSMSLGTLPRLSHALTRSISAENRTGGKASGGKATEGTGAVASRELGCGWKVSPSLDLPGGQAITLAEIDQPGVIQHMWMTVHPSSWRRLILRCYWDGEETPSVEVPIGDFFCNGWGVYCHVNSIPVAVNPVGGFNCYWQMPFKSSAKITIENVSPKEIKDFFYQIDYAQTGVSEDLGCFHARWQRSNPLPYKQVHILLDGVRGKGHYVGSYIAWGSHSNGWWGEGEMKFFLDGDGQWPTICGTGTEDYFGGAWAFGCGEGEYQMYSTAFLGLPQVIKPDGVFRSQPRFGMYRWHVMDPIRFDSDIRVTIQALAWRSPLEGIERYLPLQDDIASTAIWYQTEPHARFPGQLNLDDLEVA